MMKVLMLNIEFPPLGGGAANANFHILKELKKADVEIDLITANSKNKFELEKFSKNIRIHKLALNRKNIHFWRRTELISFIRASTKLAKKLAKENDYDLCHAFFGYPCGSIAKKTGLPYIVSLRGSDVPGYNERFGLEYKLLGMLIKGVWRDAGFMVANSQGLRDLALEFYPGLDCKIIVNGVEISKAKKVKRDWDELRVLIVSRLIQRKGIEYLLESIADLKKENIKLTIIGDGDLKQDLEKMSSDLGIEKKVKFLGYVEHKDLWAHYGESDVFVLPSLNEGMSNTVLEAIASSLPIITTDVGGTKELVDSNGFVIKKRSSKGITRALKKLLHDETLLKTMGKRSREIAEELSWEKVAQDYLDLYKKLA